jgi:hypothetical protein
LGLLGGLQRARLSDPLGEVVCHRRGGRRDFFESRGGGGGLFALGRPSDWEGVRVRVRVRVAGIVIPDDVAASLFLTWKGNKIYGHSTLASLGVRVDAQGVVKGDRGGEADGYFPMGIVLEVWSEQGYSDYLAEKGKKRRLELGSDDEDLAAGDALVDGGGMPSGSYRAPEPEAPRKKGIKIVMKAKDHEALRTTAREDTSVELLVEAFRTQREIGPEWEVAIWFDGERLDEESVLGDLDLDSDDVNQLEVHIKKVA